MKKKSVEAEKVSKEAHAYTPGLKVKRSMTINKTRRLPIPGEVFVKVGDTVDYNTIVARAQIRGDPEIVKAAIMLGVEAEDLPRYVKKKIDERVSKGEVIAAYNALFGLIKKQVVSPVDGTIESISNVTGQIIVRGLPMPVDVEAYIPGKVIEVMPNEGAVISTNSAFIQGIFGIGGETHGRLRIAVENPQETLSEDLITSEDKGKVLIGGSLVTYEALKKAV
ncbi:hypothetical protein KEJ21_06405, partial [Candidatus Bathyarchaeota archaeon]|nr:hypothetical protein [Candidatus Bathyarchaeota archaeon]